LIKKEEDYTKYRLPRIESYRKIRKEKTESWKRFAETLTRNVKTASRSFFKTFRKRDDSYNLTEIINDKQGQPLTSSKRIIERWREYFSELLNPLCINNNSTTQVERTTVLEPNILLSEVEQVVSKAHKYKAPGIDRLSTKIIQAAGDSSIRWLHRIFNVAWKQQIVPIDWQQAIITPLWKNKGSRRDCTQYRGISLLSHAGKMYVKLLESRLRPILEPQLAEEQMGFRKKQGLYRCHLYT
jgi:hypothetical protein